MTVLSTGRLMGIPIAIAVLAAGAWGISLAANETYDNYAVAAYTSPLAVITIAAAMINSLATCWLGVIALMDFSRSVRPVRFRGIIRPTISTPIRALGTLLVITSVGCVFYLFFGIYVVYVVRSVLPWTDSSPLVLYREIDLLITSICACWLGVEILRGRRSQFKM